MPFDYIIAGPMKEIVRWAEIANEAGVIECALKTYRGDCCTRFGNGCGLSDGVLAISVVPIGNVEDFVGANHEAAFIVSRKPANERPGYEERARRLVLQLLQRMNQDSVCCYEPTPDGTWIRCMSEHFLDSKKTGR